MCVYTNICFFFLKNYLNFIISLQVFLLPPCLFISIFLSFSLFIFLSLSLSPSYYYFCIIIIFFNLSFFLFFSIFAPSLTSAPLRKIFVFLFLAFDSTMFHPEMGQPPYIALHTHIYILHIYACVCIHIHIHTYAFVCV